MNYRKLAAALLAGICCVQALPATVRASESYSLGDSDGDGVVNAVDAAYILVTSAAIAVSSEIELSEEQYYASDTNRDGVIDASDAAPVLVYSACVGTGSGGVDFESFMEDNVSADSLATPQIIVGRKQAGSIIKWEPDLFAQGYEIYRYDGMSVGSTKYKLINTVTGEFLCEYLDTTAGSGSHCYKIRSFRTQDGTTIYSEFSNVDVDYNRNSILNAADLESHDTYKIYNRQGEETTSKEYVLSEKDYAILDQFAAEHFAPDATREAQLWTTLYWIHTQVNYARTTEQWDSIQGKSWVEAIFVDRTGQCAQYNGAMTAMMTYLGYDACLVRGWRGNASGNYWQHYWPEVVIDGQTYVMECGNLGKSGDWYYFLEPYSKTRKYICNGKNMS